MSTIICISHLRWDFVWQRPQHILSRLAKTGRVIFVEEPVTEEAQATSTIHLEIQPAKNAPNVTVVSLNYPLTQPRWIGHGDELTQKIYSQLLTDYLVEEGLTNSEEKPILWLYTPMALDFVEVIPHRRLIYDVMDQLSAFKGAPPELLQHEEQLLKQADVVFTGGVSLYESKRSYNPNTYLFPSGVEIEHFAKAANAASLEKPADIAELARPILGYYGVIDERMDLDLLAYLANSHPEWTLLILGPIAKIASEDLPVAPNLHYGGMKTYEQLPNYLAFFDVALIPFAINEATRFLSPTKTLEYMAAHKPIVSNPLADVVKLYGEVVRIANSPQEFATQVEAALKSPPDPAGMAKEKELLNRYTWDSIVARMLEKI